MKPRNFPYIAFGECTRCGNSGAEVDGSDADASARDTTGGGVDLEFFRGQLMCKLCITEMLDNEYASRDARRHARTKNFLSRAGFKGSI